MNGRERIRAAFRAVGEGGGHFAAIVPAGARHDVINTGAGPLRLYPPGGPPEHKDRTVHRDKDEAGRDHENDHFDGRTSE